MSDEDGRAALVAIEDMVMGLVRVKKQQRREQKAERQRLAAAATGRTHMSTDSPRAAAAAAAAAAAGGGGGSEDEDAVSVDLDALAAELSEQGQQQQEAVQEAEEEQPGSRGVQYKVVAEAVVRAGSAMGSESVGRLQVGEVISAVRAVKLRQQTDDEEEDSSDSLRVEIDRPEGGWVSTTSRSGKPLLQRLPAAAAAAAEKGSADSHADAAAAPPVSPRVAAGGRVTATSMMPQGIGLFDATLGNKSLQLQAGGMGLVVFSGGQPIGEKTALFVHFLSKTDQFNKTGSGQTQGKHSKKTIVILQRH